MPFGTECFRGVDCARVLMPPVRKLQFRSAAVNEPEACSRCLGGV